MAKTYQWKADMVSTGSVSPDTTLSRGVVPGSTNWTTEDIGTSQSGSWGFYWYDANVAVDGMYTDANASRAIVYTTESWTSSVDHLNNLTITVTTTINSMQRDIVNGIGNNTYGRHIGIARTNVGSSGPYAVEATDNTIHTIHTIWQGPQTIDTYTFTLAPGQAAERSSIFIYAYPPQFPSSYDEFLAGVHFRNTLPAPTVYTLSYDANGGTGAPTSQTYTTADGPVTFTVANGTPTWGQYQFLGWSRTQYTDSRTEADVEYRAGDTITLQESSPTVVLYAVWRKDYRPCATLSGVWLGHERPGGKCHIYNGSTFEEMRTIGGDVDQMGTPPSVYHDGKWYNQHRRGKE